MTVSDEEFEAVINASMDELPQQYIKNMKNVAVVIEDDPSPEQRAKMHLYRGQTLYGLYEGIPLTRRFGNYSGVLPDKITIFKGPISASANNPPELKALVKRTVWHEIAHHFGLDHDRIYALERKSHGIE